MATLTIRIPDDKHQRLRMLAKHRRISINKLIDELSTIAITEFDAQNRFQARSSKGSVPQALKTLDKLDKHYKKSKK